MGQTISSSPSGPRLLDPGEAAEVLHVTREALLTKVRRGEIRAIRWGYHTILFDPAELDRFLKSRMTGWTLQAVADLLFVHKWQVLKLVKRHFIPAIDLGNGEYVFDISKVMERMASHKIVFYYRPGLLPANPKASAV